MAFNVKLTTQAQLDIWDIISWYESRKPGLGERFNAEVNKMLFEIGERPTQFYFYKVDFRRAI